ncbi:S-layer homology domain-containing protein [Massilioclostridium coli]|uniref:S-layer homology domain-containing protein n=1 Tax=Massilioclostridium coli TaxID=1870991 RepID=UPI0013564656|nr:S-layer homology domain-containing protein [Massilioclostridium coli]
MKQKLALKLLSFFLSGIMVAGIMSTTAFASENTQTTSQIISQLEQQNEPVEIQPFSNYEGGARLSSQAKDIYNGLYDLVQNIVSGKTRTAKISSLKISHYKSSTLSSDFNKALNALLTDLPEQLFWYDKTQGCVYTDYKNGNLDVKMSVAKDYRDSSASAESIRINGQTKYYYFTVDSYKMKRATNALITAQNVVAQVAGKSLVEKLSYFNQWICDHVNYADATSSSYGDLFQLVYVFDGNASTNVTCEGYAKAFQYLCDMAGIQCYTVNGYVGNTASSAFAHMWNVVPMNGSNYIVDVTNNDSFLNSGFGYESFFLAGGPTSNGWTTITVDSLNKAMYQYRDDSIKPVISNSNYNSNSGYQTSDSSTRQTVRVSGGVVYRYGETGSSTSLTAPMGTRVTVKADMAKNELFTKWELSGIDALPNVSPANWETSETISFDLPIGVTSLNLTAVVKELPGVLPYYDVSYSDWFFNAARFNYDRGIITGMNETTFGPSVSMTRDHIVTMLYRMDGKPSVSYSPIYPDVPAGDFYTDAVMWGHQTGVATGYDNGYFGIGDEITREQTVTMLYRYAQHKKLDTSERTSLDEYQDGKDVSGFAKDAMEWAIGTGIIKGENNQNIINPQGSTDRAGGATMIMRFMEYYDL